MKTVPNIIIDIPSSVQTTDYSCGAAALRSVAKYYRINVGNSKEFMDFCATGIKKGTHPEDILYAALALGFNAKLKTNMSMNQLLGHIKKKQPVICAIQAYGTRETYEQLLDGHYVIAIGYDKDFIYTEDPSLKGARGKIERKDFLARWIDRESYVENPIKYRLGIVIESHETKKPTNKQILNRVKLVQ